MSAVRTILLCLAALLVVVSASQAQVAGCDVCHAKPGFKKVLKSGRTQPLFVDHDQIEASVHKGKVCIDCHVDVTEIPHTVPPEHVNCAQCHYKGNTVGAPQSDIYAAYRESVHGVAVADGDPKAPSCQDCHGSHGIRGHGDASAQMARANIPSTCGGCHLDIYAEYRASIHGTDAEHGNIDVPVCTDCHSEHGIRSHSDPASPTYVANVSETCSKCHSAEAIVGKYGIETEQVDSYDESFHGVAIRFGMRTVANCSSCHGVHDIRSPEDPASSVHIDSIPRTCGKCHPGANANFARGKMHVQPKNPSSGIVYYVASFFKWLTILTVCGLVTHILLDLVRQIRDRGKAHRP